VFVAAALTAARSAFAYLKGFPAAQRLK
jgi:hypothetical protein